MNHSESCRPIPRREVEFAISADMSRELRAEIEKLSPDPPPRIRGLRPVPAWQLLPPREGCVAKEEKWWAEVPFVPEDPVARIGERPFRYLAIRLPPRTHQLDLFQDPPERRYVAIVTNRDLPGPELIHWQREKCGTVEQIHDRLKHDLGARLFPSGNFGANAAWYRFAVIAHNLFVALQHLGLPQEWHGERLTTTRFRFLSRAGRVIRHAGRYVVVLSALAQPLLEVLLQVRETLKALTG